MRGSGDLGLLGASAPSCGSPAGCDLDVRDVLASLTRVQRRFVKHGCIHGDFQMKTVRALKRKGLFCLKISSPNGQCGFMEITALGLAVQALILAREGGSSTAEPPQNPNDSNPSKGVKP